MGHRTLAVRALLAAGMPVDARGDMGATALHWACWKGYADLVELLLNHGASLTIEDRQFDGTPPGWFGHGVHNCDEGAGDYPQVARLLIAAGATIPTVDLPTGKPDVDAVLRERGLASFTQRAGIAALRGPQDGVTAMVAEFRRRRDAICQGLNRIPGFRCTVPGGAFYAYANVEEP